jgi:antitoxin MazE
MQVGKWGNSLAVRLPAAVIDALELKEGDQIEIRVAHGRAFEVSRDHSRERGLARLRKAPSPCLQDLSSTEPARMPGKALFDTNVLIYALAQNDPCGPRAEALLAAGRHSRRAGIERIRPRCPPQDAHAMEGRGRRAGRTSGPLPIAGSYHNFHA